MEDEAGCYDYRTNVLLGKFTVGFQGESGYRNSGIIRFRVDKHLINGGLDAFELRIVNTGNQ